MLNDEPTTGWQMRDAVFLKALEGNTKALEALRGSRRSGTDDDLLWVIYLDGHISEKDGGSD